MQRDAIATLIRNFYPPQLDPHVGPCLFRTIVGMVALRHLGFAPDIGTGTAMYRVSREVVMKFNYHIWLTAGPDLIDFYWPSITPDVRWDFVPPKYLWQPCATPVTALPLTVRYTVSDDLPLAVARTLARATTEGAARITPMVAAAIDALGVM
jgi:hypothetical protein